MKKLFLTISILFFIFACGGGGGYGGNSGGGGGGGYTGTGPAGDISSQLDPVQSN